MQKKSEQLWAANFQSFLLSVYISPPPENTSTGTRYTISVPGAQSVTAVNVKDSNASGADITASFSLSSGNNDNGEASPHWVFSAFTHSPIAWWQLDEKVGTSYTDSSGNGNTGTASGSPAIAPVAGKVGGAQSFAGGNYITTNANFGDNVSSLTVTAWVYSTSGGYALSYVAKDNMGNRSWYFGMNDPTSFKVATWTDEGGRIDANMGGFTLNAWHHVAFVYDGTYITLYLDGVASGTTAQHGTITHNTTPVYIGAIGGSYPFVGALDEVRVYDAALSAYEIKQIYTYSKTNFFQMFR